MIHLRPGRAKLNGIRKTITSRIWIESMACRRSSSGKYSQESHRWALSRRFKVWRETYSVNLSTSKTVPSSSQCTTTLHGENKEIQKDVNTIHRQLRNMLVDSRAVLGLSWGSDQKRNGTEPTPTKPTDPGSEWQRRWCWNFSDSSHPTCRASSVSESGESRSKRGGKKSIHFNGSDENIELLLRTVNSANQLSVYGAIADLCNELPKDLRAPRNLQHLIIWKRWRTLVQEYERKFEQLSDNQKWSKHCSDACLKLVETGQYFHTLDTEEGQQMQHFCREFTMPRNEEGTRIRGWILKNTRISPVLNIKVCYHDDRYSIEIQIPSLFEDNTSSWVRIVNGVDKYVAESMLTKKEGDTASGKPIAKARPRQKPTVTLTSVSIPVLERKWIDIETQRSHHHKCYEVWKAMIRLPRHDQSVPRGSDGAIHYSDIIEECRKKKFDNASQWLLENCRSILAKGGGAKKNSILREPKLLQPSPVPWSNPRTFRRIMLLISHYKTVDYYRKDLPSTTTTSGTRVNWIPQ